MEMPEICSQLIRTEGGSGDPQTCSCILDSLVEVWALNLELANFKLTTNFRNSL